MCTVNAVALDLHAKSLNRERAVKSGVLTAPGARGRRPAGPPIYAGPSLLRGQGARAPYHLNEF